MTQIMKQNVCLLLIGLKMSCLARFFISSQIGGLADDSFFILILFTADKWKSKRVKEEDFLGKKRCSWQ